MLWPMLLDYSRNDCKRVLRKLELEAYASIVTAFRAQGELSKDKKKMLHDLCSILSISMERHRAEIRRAVNDEKLNTIADRMAGPNTGTDWAIEGRRLVPLMPRLVPQTAFTALANNLANMQAAKNASMPLPSATGQYCEGSGQEESKPAGEVTSPLPSSLPTTPVKVQGSGPLTPQGSGTKGSTPPGGLQNNASSGTSTGSNVVLLPSGMAIQLKGNEPGTLFLPEDERESMARKRKRSTSLDSTGQPQQTKVLVTSALPPGSSSGRSTSPVVMTSTPVTGRNVQTLTATRGQQIHKTTIQGAQGGSKQVILVSGSSGSLPSSILQRCLSVPMPGKAPSTPVSCATYKSTATSTYSVASSPSSTAMSTVSSVLHSPVVTASPVSSSNMLVYTTTSRPRSRTVSSAVRPNFRPRGMLGAGPGSMGQPGGPGSVQFPTPPQKMQKPTTTYLRTPGMYRPDSSPGVKILTQNVTPPVRPRTPQSATSFVAAKPPVVSQAPGSSPRIVNVMSINPSARVGGGTSLISTRLPAPSKLGQAIASRISSASGGAKPNVIVVHKAQVWPQQQQQQLGQGTSAFVVTKTGQTYKDIMTYSQKQQQTLMKSPAGISVMKPSFSGVAQTRTVQTPSSTVTITTTTSMPSTTSPSSSILELDPSQFDEQKNTLLADLIQAAGIAPDAAAVAAAAVVSVAMETFPPQMQTTTVTTTVAPSVAPVSLVSSIPTPCVAQMSNVLEAEEGKEIISEDIQVMQLGELMVEEAADISTEQSPASTSGCESSSITVTAPAKSSLSSLPTATSTISTIQSQQEKESDDSESSVSIHEIEMPLDHFQEGQVLEIQAPDASALLNSDGHLSKEVLEILHQAGFQLQNDQVTIDTSGLDMSGTTVELHLEGAGDDATDKKDKETVISPQLDPSTGLLYMPSGSITSENEELKNGSLPSMVSVFASSDLQSSQLDLDTLKIVEDVLTRNKNSLQEEESVQSTTQEVCVSMESPITSCGSVPQTFLDIPDLQSELIVIEETATDVSNVVVESADKPYSNTSMSIDNVMVEVDSTEFVVSGEEVQVDSTIIESNVLVETTDYPDRNRMEFL